MTIDHLGLMYALNTEPMLASVQLVYYVKQAYKEWQLVLRIHVHHKEFAG